jgi:hypothetical protein
VFTSFRDLVVLEPHRIAAVMHEMEAEFRQAQPDLRFSDSRLPETTDWRSPFSVPRSGDATTEREFDDRVHRPTCPKNADAAAYAPYAGPRVVP